MATVYRFRVALTGFTGSPGVNSWFIGGLPAGGELTEATANGAAALLREFYNDVRAFLQQDVTATVEETVTALDDASGDTVGVVAVTTPPAAVSGSGTQPASHATMLKIRLLTDVFEDSRRIRGGVFLGPLNGDSISNSGSVFSTTRLPVIAALNDLAQGLEAQGTPLVVWRRPREATEDLPARDGSSALVTVVSCGTLPAVLRSRRD